MKKNRACSIYYDPDDKSLPIMEIIFRGKGYLACDYLDWRLTTTDQDRAEGLTPIKHTTKRI